MQRYLQVIAYRLSVLLLCAFLGVGQAGAGMMLLGVGGGSSALPGPPTFTFRNGSTGSASNTTFAVTTGTASANRLVVTVIIGFGGASANVATATYDGSITGIVTTVRSIASGFTISVITAPIPLNASSTLVVTGPSASGTYRSINYTTDSTTLASTTPTFNTNPQASGVSNVNSITAANSGSVLIAAAFGGNPTSFTASTPTITSDVGFNVTVAGHVNSVSAGSASVTTGWSGSTANDLALILFR